MVAAHKRALTSAGRIQGHSEHIKNLTDCLYHATNFVTASASAIQITKNEALGAHRFGIGQAWMRSMCSKALLGIKGFQPASLQEFLNLPKFNLLFQLLPNFQALHCWQMPKCVHFRQ